MLRPILKHKFLTDSLVMVLGSNVYNFSQVLYHFLAVRYLTRADYGDLAAVISILGFIGVIQIAFNLTIVKYISSIHDTKQLGGFIKWIFTKSFLIGLCIAIIIIGLAVPLTNFLNIRGVWYIIILSPILFFFIATMIGRSVLQGLLRFDQYVYSLLAEAGVKIILAIILFALGYQVFGALFAYLLSLVIACAITIYILKKYLLDTNPLAPDIKPFIKYSGYVFIQGLALTSMYSTDLLIVKHFFSSDQAGLYAALAILGRVVFFGSSPIVHVMFPIVAKRHKNGEQYTGIMVMSTILILMFSLAITGIYYYFPALPLGLLFGKNFLDGSELLWLFAVFMALISLAMLLTQFYLSIGKTKPVYFFVVAAILQAILIWVFHPSLYTVIVESILVATLLVISLFVYFIYIKKHSLQ